MKNQLLLTEIIPFNQLKNVAYSYEELIKGVCDVTTNQIVMGGEWHSDAEQVLVAMGNSTDNIWGFNIYYGTEENKPYIVYQSMINIKPKLNHKSMIISDERTIERIKTVIEKYIIL